jgi:hypothetical protein
MSPKNRSIWSPACPMHCYYNYGEMDDPDAAKWAIPAGTENTLGETSHWFFYQNLTGAYIDQVNWPDNAACSGAKSSS